MAAKRALIVDDSRSARLILERILERHAIDVDSAETAEAAIEYLGTHIPDVIFMDHMMPGMDGLQAVAAIKNNPRTASIPIMMYTSQAGEVYLGQARALGAFGVLPKQIKPADVSKVLSQLHLVEDRRPDEQSTFQAPQEPALDPMLMEDQVIPTLSRPLTDATLREHFAELRRALIASADTQTDRLGAELRAVLLETRGAQVNPVERSQVWSWVIAGGALVLAAVLGSLWLGDSRRLSELSAQVTALQARLGPVSSPQEPLLVPDTDTPVQAPVARVPKSAALHVVPAADLRPLNLPLPFGGEAMGGGRLESIRQFLYRLARDGVAGVVDIKTFAGRFCLVGNAVDGFSLAPDDMPYAKCDVVGNPPDDALSPAQRTPLALANLVGEIRHATRGMLDVQVSVGDASVTLVPYPVVGTELTAGEWNHAGSSNNRVEVRLR